MFHRPSRNFALLILLVLIGGLQTAEAQQQPIPIAEIKRSQPVHFGQEILPIMRKNCLACHSASEAYGELVLETPETIQRGGDSGPAVIPGKGAESLLLKVAAHQSDPLMPPPENDVAAKPLTSQELGLLKLWIDQGASGSGNSGTLSPQNWRELPAGVNPIYAAALTPDGQLAACGRANQIFIYHVPTGQLITRLTDPTLLPADDPRPGIAHRDLVQSLAFNRQGDLLASGGFRTVKLWRRPRDVRELELADVAETNVGAVAVSREAGLMAAGSADSSIKILKIADGELVAELTGHTGEITQLVFISNGEQLISSSTDGSLRVWEPASGELVSRLDTPGPVQAFASLHKPTPAADELAAAAETSEPAAQPQHLLVTAGTDENIIRAWQLPPALSSPWEAAEPPTAMALSLDNRRLALGTEAGKITILDYETRQPLLELSGHTGPVTDLAFNQDGTRLASASADRTARYWALPPLPVSAENTEAASADAAAAAPPAEEAPAPAEPAPGTQLAVLHGGLTSTTEVSLHPTAPQLITGMADGGVTVWNLETPAPRSLIAAASPDNPNPQPADIASRGPAAVSAISPDGKLLAVGAVLLDRPAIEVREVETGRVVQQLFGHAEPIKSLAFSPNGSRLVSGSQDGTARVWNLADAKFPEIAHLSGHTAAVNSVAFNADGQQVLTGGADNAVKLWKVADATVLQELAGHTAPVAGVAMLPSGQTAIAAAADNTIRYWNPADGKPGQSITLPAAATSLAVSPNGATLAVAAADGTIRLYSAADGKPLLELTGHTKPVRSLTFSLDSTRLLSCEPQSQSIVWDVATGRLLEMLPNEQVAGATFAGTAETIATGTLTGQVELHSLRFARPLVGFSGAITGICHSVDGNTAYVSSLDGTLRGYQLANGQQSFAADHTAPVYDLDLSPNGQLLATAGENKEIRVWNANGSPAAKPQLTGFTDAVHNVCFSSDGARVMGAGAEDPEIRVFLVVEGALEQRFVQHELPIAQLIATHGEGAVDIISADQTLRTWSLAAGRRFPGHSQPISSLARIPADEPQFLSGSLDGTVRHWNAITGQAVRAMSHGAAVHDIAVRPDGQRFASVSENNTVRLWNGANGQQLAEQKGDIRTQRNVQRIEREIALTNARIETRKARVAALEMDAPVKAKASEDALAALAAAGKEVAAKKADLEKALAAKTAAEKTAIEAAAAAQVAAIAAAKANRELAQATAANEQATLKATATKNLAAADPEDQDRAAAAAAAAKDAEAAAAAVATATAAKTAADKTAADAAAAANTAAQAAVTASKPAVDAANALTAAEDTETAAQQAADLAQREAKEAAEAVPQAKAILAATEAGLAKLQADLEAGKQAAAASERPLRTVAFAPDGQTLVAAGDLGVIHAFNADTGGPTESFHGHTGPVLAFAFASNDQLVTSSEDKSISRWALNPGWILERTLGDVADPSVLIHRVAAVGFSPGGEYLCAGSGEPSRSGQLAVFRVSDGSLVRSLPDAHSDAIFGLEVSPDGSQVATAAADKYVRIFDIETGELVQQFEGHTNHVLGVSWQSNGREIASSGADNAIKIWNVATAEQLRTIANFNKQISSVSYVGDSPNVLAAVGDGTIQLRNSGNGGAVRNFTGGTDFMYSAAATADGSVVIAGGHDSVLRVWNGANGQVLQTFAPPQPEPPAGPDITSQAANE